MKCPKCAKAQQLKATELLGGVEVDYCAACSGMYFQKGEMGSYLKFSTDLPNYKELLAAASDSVACPECAKRMKEVRYVPGKDLVVDYCAACGGVWLDGGELEQAHDVARAQDDRKVRLMRAIWELRTQVRGEKTFTCPKCTTPSVQEFKTGEDVTLDMCDRCNGTWFEKGEIASYFELSKDIPDLKKALAGAKPTAFGCPRCKGEKLVDMEYAELKLKSGPLHIDYCKKCQGIWLDKGEITSLECLSTTLETPGARLGRAVKELMDKGYVLMS